MGTLASAPAGSPRRLPHDAVIVRQGDPAARLYLLEQGAVRLSRVTVEGREVVIGVLSGGEVFGETALLGGPSPVEARTIGPSLVVGIDVERLPDLLQRSPRAGLALVRQLAARIHRTERVLGDALTTDLSTMISRRLRDLAEARGSASPATGGIAVAVTQEELARMVGASREAVNRSLRTLAARDLVRTHRRALVIPDLEALAGTP
jgi:CRP/FNR family transcriptional regulator, cyclic AMP receptor protein